MNYKKSRIEAVVLSVFLVGVMLLASASSVSTNYSKSNTIQQDDDSVDLGPLIPDRTRYVDPEPAPMSADGSNDDAGYKSDAGNEISRADAIYPGEVVDDTPGRGQTGKLDSGSDQQDWYFFSVCEGQDIIIDMTPPMGYNYDIGLWDEDEIEQATSTNSGSTPEHIEFTATMTGRWYLVIEWISGSGEAQYSFSVVMDGQNDAGTGNDAPDNFADAITISEGAYHGYLDMNDPYDWYKFNVNDGDGIHFILSMKNIAYLSDFDISLYNPSGEFVYEEDYYYDDEMLYPADESGMWRIKIDIFPGWVDVPQPTEWDYYEYGSGAYELEFIIESSAPAPPGPIPQPDITPVAKTFIVNNDPDSNKDEYGYLASVPACNYLDGTRHLSPIVYQGDDTTTNYFGTEYDRGVVDDTTQYLLDDWSYYLSQYGKSTNEYTVPADPVEASADIASTYWTSSDLAVVAVDGSDYQDNVKTALSKTKTLKREYEETIVPNDSEDIVDIGGSYGYPMNLKSKWCLVNVSMIGTGGATPTLNAILPQFMPMAEDWWPSPYDGPGNKIDIFFPVTRAGVWTAGTDRITGSWNFDIKKIAGDRYRMWVKDSDASIHVKVETDDPSDLLVFLVDPQGYLRAPDIPQWNGPVNPIHVWNGFENPAFNPWRTWNPEPHTEFAAEVLHPEKGLWTVIVVPRYAEGDDITYTVTGEVAYTNQDRADAAISAANAAVIASQEHAPLLYVKEDSIPTVTQDCFDNLGVQNVIFVERGGIGSAVKSDLPTVDADLTTMQEIVDYIKAYDQSENYITITSIKESKAESTQPYNGVDGGYFAPAAMIAAYHCSPVLRIDDANVDGLLRTKVDPAAVADRIETWQLWDGDYYHGSRSTGHLPQATEPVEQNKLKILIQMIKYLTSGTGTLPPFGLDAKRYWNEEVYNGIHDYIDGLGLDLDGQEGYCFVAPRKDIAVITPSVMMGNNSYGGQIVGHTPAYAAQLISRDLLYPALIFANDNRDITTTQMMNFPDGGTWRTNDGQTQQVYSSRVVKKAFGSHGRTYDGHTLWEAHLQRMNEGASAMYYSGHGTGGSGISAQYEQTDESNYPEQIWWDAWRGYSYDSWKMPRNNGQVWYNPEPPMLYDIIHYDYNDELLENLHDMAVYYMSCTTADADGPMVYLDHGAVIFYGNAGTGLCPEADLQDDEFFTDTFIYGEPIGPAYSKQVWLHYRDFTTSDPTSMYGTSSMQVTTIQVIYGDPLFIVYSPEWTEPIPIDA